MVRLDRIITRSGDGGTTSLSDGSRLPKHHPLIAAIGAVDEANTVLGMVRIEVLPEVLAEELARVQNDCFDLGSDLATPPGGPYEAKIARITAAQVLRLETAAERANAALVPLTSFVLPGGSRSAAWLHLARTTVRRAERDLSAAIAALPERAFNPECLRYLNRLSDLCFIWSRQCNDDGKQDVLWVPGRNG
ncbi:MAG: cob(I)yrinic acid a,c-diamide adenosyltransferase [Planctomycetes bacterium]|nr:cob(I)yrinic acid a,c-diamide adenosyltransferase [Planctomycetota bacterium]